MRLLHVVPSYLPAVRYGGPVFAVHGLCRALVDAGHEVDVFTTRVDGPDDVAAVPGARTDLDGVGVHYFDVVTPRRWYRSPALARALGARVGDYDLVHVHALFLHPVSAGAHAARGAGVPYVVSPRGMLVRELFARRSAVAKRCWMALLGRRVIEGADALHVTSEREAEDVARFGLALPRVVVVPNGVSATQVPSIARDPARVVFVGRLSWKKGIERLIEAIALLPGCTLVIAGNDDEGLTPRLQALARRLGVADRVGFEGPVEPGRRDALLAGAGVFVLPSYSENFANTVLEAMAAGCPVVVTPEVGLAETVRAHGCGRVSAGEPGALARSIGEVMSDPARAAAMGEAGRALVHSRFQWPGVAARMVSAYADLLAAAGSPRAA